MVPAAVFLSKPQEVNCECFSCSLLLIMSQVTVTTTIVTPPVTVVCFGTVVTTMVGMLAHAFIGQKQWVGMM